MSLPSDTRLTARTLAGIRRTRSSTGARYSSWLPRRSWSSPGSTSSRALLCSGIVPQPTGIRLDVPGRGELALELLVLDLNGTLTNRAQPIDGVAERLRELAPKLEVTILSADTFGVLDAVGASFGVRTRHVATGEDKARCIWELGAERCAAIGNGANDAAMLELAALGIAVVGPEGAAG